MVFRNIPKKNWLPRKNEWAQYARIDANLHGNTITNPKEGLSASFKTACGKLTSMDELVNELVQQAFLRCPEMIQSEFDAEPRASTMPVDCHDREMFIRDSSESSNPFKDSSNVFLKFP